MPGDLSNVQNIGRHHNRENPILGDYPDIVCVLRHVRNVLISESGLQWHCARANVCRISYSRNDIAHH